VPLEGLQGKFVFSLILGVAVVFALSLYANGSQLLATLRHFNWALIPLVLGLTLFNYALRFLKWHFYLGQIGARVSRMDSFAIFTAGLSMAMTPGKVGEVLKPVLLRLRTGVPVSRSTPIIMAERLTDGLAMIILALGGLALSHAAWQILLLSLLLAVTVVGLLGSTRGGAIVLHIAERLPFVGPRLTLVEAFLHSSRQLFTPRNLLFAVSLGVISWAGEAAAFYLVLTGIGFHPSMLLLIQATFVLATSTLVGSLSLLPGGLGATDASVAGLLILVVHAARAKAAAATLIIRFCTLWFGVGIGLLALFIFRHRLHREGMVSEERGTSLAILASGGK
jgi:uncharacterized membrane protein YbhN (UPF0104 family)